EPQPQPAPEPEPQPQPAPEPQPQPAPAPEQQPAPVEKEPVALTAREELMLPLKAFGAAIVAGSPLLGRWIVLTRWRGVREVSRTQGSGTPKKTAPTKGEEDADGQEAAEAAPAAKSADTGGFGDLVEQFVLGGFSVAVGCVVLTGGLGMAWPYIAPYAWWLVLAVIVGWCLAVVAFAPEEDADTPENDHDELAGEEPQEGTPEDAEEGEQEQKGEPWPVVQERLRRFVEERVAAGHGGHNPKVKGKGARLDDLLAELQENGALPGMGRRGFMELLAMAEIPYREQMKFRVFEDAGAGLEWKQKNVPGVHVDDLTKNIGHAPRLPAHLVPSIGPSGAPISPPDPAPIPAPGSAAIPAARTPGK
ncbi:hypothetical protein, partial [Streptomyces mirabilis]|uniref:hypothetical protein n=1 Tax=Streptomyces mirabilis TaxID=68239 RepID=UPI0036EF43F5